MWIPKGVALIRGGRLFEARRLLDEIRYIDSDCLYSQKRLIFHKSKRVLADNTQIRYFNFFFFFDLCVPIYIELPMYKIRLLKIQGLNSYRTFVIQKTYGVGYSPSRATIWLISVFFDFQ